MTGPLPSVTAMKKIMLTAVTVVAWFLPGHLALLALLVLVWGSAMVSTANTAKARSTEDRLAAQVTATAPAVNLVTNGGTIGGSLTVNGDHTVTGNTVTDGSHTVYGALGVHTNATVLGTMGVSGSTSLNGGATISGTLGLDTLSVGGDATVNGDHTVIGSLGVHQNATILGTAGVSGNTTLNTLGVNSNATVEGTFGVNSTATIYGSAGVHGNMTVLGTVNGANIPSSPPGSAPAPPTGTGGASSYCGNFYTGSGAANWAQNISDSVDQVISALISAGIFS